jgi:hypothetical protein
MYKVDAFVTVIAFVEASVGVLNELGVRVATTPAAAVLVSVNVAVDISNAAPAIVHAGIDRLPAD